ncbi:MAG TPA: hypothetical protein VFS43_42295 [Polyangiaceae bacterium]|nr:hypothetical protein [Polyangiaceae bacterium]
MSAPSQAYWLGLAAEVGVLIAPAGLNYVVPSTTYWLYGTDATPLDAPPGWSFRATGVRVAFGAESLRRELARLRAADAQWRAVLRGAPHRPPSPGATKALRAQVDLVARELPEFPLRSFLWRAASLLKATHFAAEYDPEYYPGHSYVFELLDNGLTFVNVRRAAPDAP